MAEFQTIQLPGLDLAAALNNSDLLHVRQGANDRRFTYETLLTELQEVFYTETESDDRFLNQSNNLSDLDSVTTARSNLGLGSAALLDEGLNSSDVLSLATLIQNVGVGGNTPNLLGEFPSGDLDEVTSRTMVGTVTGSWINGPLNDGAPTVYAAQLIVLRRSFTTNQIVQILVNFEQIYFRVGNASPQPLVFGDWQEFFHTGNLDVFTQTESDARYLQIANDLGEVVNPGTARSNIGALGEVDANNLYNRRDANLGDVGDVNIARSNLGVISEAQSNNTYLQRDNNLGDLGSISAARNNLNVLSEAETDSRYLDSSNNLSDLPDKDQSRINLDVFSRQESADLFLDAGNNLSELTSPPIARNNLGVLSSAENDSRYVRTTTNDQMSFGSTGQQTWYFGAIAYNQTTNTLQFALPPGWSATLNVGGANRAYIVRINTNIATTRYTVLTSDGGDINLTRYNTGLSGVSTASLISVLYGSSSFFSIYVRDPSTGSIRTSGSYNVDFQLYRFNSGNFTTGSLIP